jgi:L-serine dehydratase
MYSIFELFKIGVGPSSSHTVGPMIAANRFASDLVAEQERVDATQHVLVELFGSLALTGRGHATDSAIIAGLSGCVPATIDPADLAAVVDRVRTTGKLTLHSGKVLSFDEPNDLLFRQQQSLPFHPNGIRFTALDAQRQPIWSEQYYSVGGGFVVSQRETDWTGESNDAASLDCPFPFTSAAELLDMCRVHGLTIEQIVDANELQRYSRAEIDERLDELWVVMQKCIAQGCRTEGILPGGLNVRRRAPGIYQKLSQQRLDPGADCESAAPAPNTNGQPQSLPSDPLRQLDFVSLYALAVNEQNAAGGRVVTAPTNGAAGVIPAVLMYYMTFHPGATIEGARRMLKTAGAIGLLYKRNASLSAAEMGCQGEVGVACSMAAAGLAACMGGTPAQIANAAEIGMEHNLGLTCDPVGGLVQIPCIERNTMGAAKAINAARLAVLYGDGSHKVSLDRVIETMRQTGVDMQSKYKETSLGGLAVNVVNC